MIPRRNNALFLAALLISAACGETKCPPIELPQPMSEVRAKELDPNVTTGLALSATHIFGDCGPTEIDESPEDPCAGVRPACVSERAPLRVLVLPVNQSIPRSEGCASHVAVLDLAPRAIVDRRAAESGELVLALPAGRYLVYLSRDDRCAACGIEAQGTGCLADVAGGSVTARDLVIDRSTR